jgi:Thiamine pyrophosphate enzyme, N-terminal TPP binding domain
MAKTVADQMVETLAAAQVSRIYGIVGDSLNGFTDALRRHGGIQWLHVRHEEVAAFAAGADAHVTGGLAVCAGSWAPPDSADVERDRIVGERGDELVYGLDFARLRAAGHPDPEKHVAWTSRSNPGADHDIMSVAADGNAHLVTYWFELAKPAMQPFRQRTGFYAGKINRAGTIPLGG